VEAAQWWEQDASTIELCRSGRNPAKPSVFGRMFIEGKPRFKRLERFPWARMTGAGREPRCSFMPPVQAGKGVARGWFDPGRDLILACYIGFVYLWARPLIEPDSKSKTRDGRARLQRVFEGLRGLTAYKPEQIETFMRDCP